MKVGTACRDMELCVIDCGHRIEPIACEDESGLAADDFLAGINRAEMERRYATALQGEDAGEIGF